MKTNSGKTNQISPIKNKKRISFSPQDKLVNNIENKKLIHKGSFVRRKSFSKQWSLKGPIIPRSPPQEVSDSSSVKKLKKEKRRARRDARRLLKEEKEKTLKEDDPFQYFFGKPDPDKLRQKRKPLLNPSGLRSTSTLSLLKIGDKSRSFEQSSKTSEYSDISEQDSD